MRRRAYVYMLLRLLEACRRATTELDRALWAERGQGHAQQAALLEDASVKLDEVFMEVHRVAALIEDEESSGVPSGCVSRIVVPTEESDVLRAGDGRPDAPV